MAFFSSIAAAFTAYGVWFAGLSAVGQFAVRLGVSLAVNALAGAIAGRGGDKPRAAGIVSTIQQGADVPRSFIAGRYATRGSLAYHNTWGQDGDTPNAYYTRVTALSDLPIKGLVEVWIDGVRCSLGTVADPQRGFPVVEYSGRRSFESYAFTGDRVTVQTVDEDDVLAWVKFYDGTQAAADGFVSGTVATPERPWSSDEIGAGVAYAVTTFRFDRERFQGLPDVLYVLDGIEIEDPERGGTGTADANPAAIAYAILRGLSYAGQWVYGPQGRGAGRVRAEEWAGPVADCRAPVPRAVEMSDAQRRRAFGSTEIPEKYRAGLEITVDRAPSDVLADVLAACAGRIAETGTRYKMKVGDAVSVDFTLTDADIVSTAEQEFVPFLGIADSVNGVSSTYPAPDEGWAMQNAPPRYVAAHEAEDGDRRLLTDVALVAVPFAEQVQRLQKSVLAEARRARRHSLVLPPRFAALEPMDTGPWDSARNGYQAKEMRVDGVAPLPNGNVQVDLTEIDPAADYYWRPAVDYVPVIGGSIAPVTPGVVAVSGFTVSAITIRGGENKPRRPALRLRWIPVRGVRALAWRVRVQATGAIVADGVVEDVEAGMKVVSEGLLRKTVYEAQVKFRPRGSLRGIWTAWTAATTDDVGLQPEDVDELTWTAVDGRAGAVAELLQLEYDTEIVGPMRQSILDHGVNLRDLEDADAGFAAAQAALTQTVEDNRLAMAADVVRLQAEIDDAEGEIATTAAAVSGLATRVTNNEGTLTSQAEDITSLTSRIGTAESNITAGTTARNNLTTRVTSAEGKITSQGQSITALQSDLTDAESGISANASAQSALATRVTSAEGKITSQASSIASLSAEVDDVTADVSSQAAVIAKVDGTVAAAYLWRTRAGGATGEIELISGSTPNGASSLFKVKADRFQFLGEWTDFFSNVRITGGLVVSKSFTRNLFDDGELQVPLYPVMVDYLTSSDSNWQPRFDGLAQVIVIGGGGAGGLAKDSDGRPAAGGGAAGGCAIQFIPSMARSQRYNIKVGGGGNGRASSDNEGTWDGYTGGQSYFRNHGQDITANGGEGGHARRGSGAVAPGSTGGTASGGLYNRSGGDSGGARAGTSHDTPSASGGAAFDFGLAGLQSTPQAGPNQAGNGYGVAPSNLPGGAEVSGFMLNGYDKFKGGDGTARLDVNVGVTGDPGGVGCGGGGVAINNFAFTSAVSGAGGDGLVVVIYYGAGNLT